MCKQRGSSGSLVAMIGLLIVIGLLVLMLLFSLIFSCTEKVAAAVDAIMVQV